MLAKCPPCKYWPNVRWPYVRWPNVCWPNVPDSLLYSFIDVIARNILYFAFCRLMQDILYFVLYGLEKH